MDTPTIRYHLIPEDLATLCVWHGSTSTQARYSWLRAHLVNLAAFLTGAFLFILIQEYEFAAVLVIAGVAWTLFYPRYVNRRAMTLTTQMIEDGPGGHGTGRHALLLEDDALVEIGPWGQVRINLRAIARVSTAPAHTFIYYGPVSAIIVPRDRITDGDLSAFLAALEERVEQAKAEATSPPV